MSLQLAGLTFSTADDLSQWFRDACAASRGVLPDDLGPADALERLWRAATPDGLRLISEAALHLVGLGPNAVRAEALRWSRYKSHGSLTRGLLYFTDADWVGDANPQQPDQPLGRALLLAITTGVGAIDLKQRARLQRLALRFDALDLLLWHDLREDPQTVGFDTLRRFLSVGGHLDPLSARALAAAYRDTPLLHDVASLLRHRPAPLRAAFAAECKARAGAGRAAPKG
jgi:hypothetical protein